MEKVLTNGFCEMTQDEILSTEGGIVDKAIVAGVVILAFICMTKGCADADAGK